MTDNATNGANATDGANAAAPGTDTIASSGVAAPPARRSTVKIAVQFSLLIGALGVSAFVLAKVFGDLDFADVLRTARSLDGIEVLALVNLWILWLAAQGLQTAALVPGLPVRRGVLAYLGPAAIGMVTPGPSDLPVRHRMLRSWGQSAGDAGLAVAAGGIFSIGIKLVLPVVAALGLILTDAPVEGTLRTILIITCIVGVGMGVIGVVLASERRTVAAARVLAPVWGAVLRLLRRPVDEDLVQRLVNARSSALDTLRGRWLVAAWGTVLSSAARFGLLLMSLRFMDVSTGELAWTSVFIVYALVGGLTVLPLTAGDAGVSEVAYIGMLSAAAGTDSVNRVTAAVLVFRILTWIVLIPAGLVALAVWKLSIRRQRATRAVAAQT